jgi:serine/threonine protein kinase
LQLVDALRIARQVTASLAVAQASGVIHRDLKPANIFLVHDAEAQAGERTKLLDFGICQLALEGEELATLTGTMLGTPAYMSPEQCRGTSGRSDPTPFVGCCRDGDRSSAVERSGVGLRSRPTSASFRAHRACTWLICRRTSTRSWFAVWRRHRAIASRPWESSSTIESVLAHIANGDTLAPNPDRRQLADLSRPTTRSRSPSIAPARAAPAVLALALLSGWRRSVRAD